MNKLYKLIILSVLAFSTLKMSATTFTIVNSGFTFSPSTLTITLGDTVIFSIAGNHNSVEVSQATWNANGNTSNGGYALGFGGGILIPTQVKTYYYVCQPHASMGMKGQIIVNSPTGIPTVDSNDKILKFQPNPVASKTTIHTGITDGKSNTFIIFDITGKEVFKMVNVMNNYLLDASFLKNGIYFAEIRSEGYRRTSKLVVSRNDF
jgi:plastocyanin